MHIPAFIGLSLKFWPYQTGRLSFNQAIVCSCIPNPPLSSTLWLGALLIGLEVTWPILQFVLNAWNKTFFNAIEAKSLPDFYKAFALFMGIIICMTLTNVMKERSKELLTVRWRQWLTRLLVNWHLKDASFGSQVSNFDQRLTEDIATYCHLSLKIATELLSKSILVIGFSIILWNASKAVQLSSGEMAPHGLLFWGALVYALIANSISYALSKPLYPLDKEQERTEAVLRTHFVHRFDGLKATLEPSTAHEEHTTFGDKTTYLLECIKFNKLQLIIRRMKINLGTGFFFDFNSLFPYLLCAPLYFKGALSFGEMMQTCAGFISLNWGLLGLMTLFPEIAQWRSSLSRLSQLIPTDKFSVFESKVSFAPNNVQDLNKHGEGHRKI